jgi:deoxyhypusine synthase
MMAEQHPSDATVASAVDATAHLMNPSDSATTPRPHDVPVPSVSATAVLVESEALPPETPECRGHDFGRQPNTIEAIVESMMTTGFQATNLGRAVEQIRSMRRWRLSDVPFVDGVDDPALQPPSVRSKIRARIFLAYTSNQISCGQREVIRYLVQNRMVDVLITTAGGIEEDLIKCLRPTYMGEFGLPGRDLRRRGINRIGNLLVPNKNYCDFEDWVSPILNEMHDELDAATLVWAQARAAAATSSDGSIDDGDGQRFLWTPSKVIERLGRKIDHPDSVLYWAGA